MQIGDGVCGGSQIGGNVSFTIGANPGYSGTAHTKGSWNQLTASCPFDVAYMLVNLGYFGSAFSAAFDIAVGASGSEVIIANNLLLTAAPSYGAMVYGLPCTIPAGSAISVRRQSGDSAQAVVQIVLYAASFDEGGCMGVDAIGFNAATTLGTTLTPSTTANTKGSYAQLSAATARDYYGLTIVFDTLNFNPSYTGKLYMVDLAIGAGGSETVIMPDLIFWNVWGTALPQIVPLPIQIPAGTRIAARAQQDGTTNPQIGITVYGGYK
jgi:hypothetical protein